jgi:predicted ATPase
LLISRIEALRYRSLRYVDQRLEPFQVLVGPNGSGKTTFLDTVGFLGTLVADGLDAAIGQRTSNFSDLVWARENEQSFELALEADLEANQFPKTIEAGFASARYEVAVGPAAGTGELSILAERVLLRKQASAPTRRQVSLFPSERRPPKTILSPKSSRKARTIINKHPGGNDNFYSEAYEKPGKGWMHAFRLGSRKAALANLPDDEENFPVATWLKATLAEGVQQLVLNSLLLRRASPPGQVTEFRTDGSNLPWVVHSLEERHPERLRAWIAHLRTAIGDLENIRTVERPEDRQRYLMVRYSEGFEIHLGSFSDGTLRLLALTLPAYLPDFSGVYLIEEPENGIHPRAVETMCQSLSSAYSAQILAATHSPVIMSTVEPKNVLCFAKDAHGATDIVSGSEHPALQEWRGEENLGVLFAAGVLG